MARIYTCDLMSQADIRVAITNDEGQADLLVYRAPTRGLAHGDSAWLLVKDRDDATSRICLCSMGMANVKVCFVDVRGRAGWQTANHRYKGRF